MKWKRNRRDAAFKLGSRFTIFGIILALGILALLLNKSNFFTIKTIDIQARNIDCVNLDQLKSASGLWGQNFLFINFKKLESDLKSQFVCIRSISTSRHFPDRIKLEAQGREAAIILIVSSNLATNSAVLRDFIEASSSAHFSFPSENGQVFLIDSEGIIYSKDIKSGLRVYARGLTFKLGQKVSDDLINAIKILEKIKKFQVNIKDASIFEKILLINATPRIIFGLNRNIDTQTASLQLILEKAKINRGTIPTEVGLDSSDLEFIDLRFDKPIVRIAPKK